MAQAGGGSVWRFQLKGYGNIIRGYALLQVILLAVIIGVVQEKLQKLTAVLVVFLLVDTLLFILCGPTPLSPMGCLVTCLVWSRRGPAVTLIPYKVVFAFYAVGVVRQLLCGGDCHHTAVYSSFLANSALLAAFRL